jgi:hypothetical protein
LQVERAMWPGVIVVAQVFGQRAPQVAFTENEQVTTPLPEHGRRSVVGIGTFTK